MTCIKQQIYMSNTQSSLNTSYNLKTKRTIPNIKFKKILLKFSIYSKLDTTFIFWPLVTVFAWITHFTQIFRINYRVLYACAIDETISFLQNTSLVNKILNLGVFHLNSIGIYIKKYFYDCQITKLYYRKQRFKHQY